MDGGKALPTYLTPLEDERLEPEKVPPPGISENHHRLPKHHISRFYVNPASPRPN